MITRQRAASRPAGRLLLCHTRLHCRLRPPPRAAYELADHAQHHVGLEEPARRTDQMHDFQKRPVHLLIDHGQPGHLVEIALQHPIDAPGA